MEVWERGGPTAEGGRDGPRSRVTMRKTSLRLFSLFALLTALLGRPVPVAPQDDWAKRNAWQRPEEVMDALGLKPESVVADVGCGSGYFTLCLAHRVGSKGKVYAVDIEWKELSKLSSRATKEGLTQVETILGAKDDPRLPAESLDAILVVNAYHEMLEYDAMMQAFHRALKPQGLLCIIEKVDRMGEPRATYQDRHTLPEEIVHEDAARNRFHFLREESGFNNPDGDKFYFLIFEKPKS